MSLGWCSSCFSLLTFFQCLADVQGKGYAQEHTRVPAHNLQGKQTSWSKMGT
jgi:hypothetical protein